jgi:hypothetical protein
MSERTETADKALRINLDPLRYGTFAEIGAGQEVARWFFRVGGAAGTVAKTMSAYDMQVSDAIYGECQRYVSRERLAEMLDHEYRLLLERLSESRGDKTAFFVFADTVATRNFKGDNEAHGWIGLRFQHEPKAPPSDCVVHVALSDPTAQRQQESLGVLGVNLLSAAFYPRPTRQENLKSLHDGLSAHSLEIDVLEFSGPAFRPAPGAAEIGAELVAAGLTHAVVMDENGRLDQPSGVLRKHGLLVHRAWWGDEPALEAMFRFGAARLAEEKAGGERGPLGVAEISLPEGEAVDGAAVAERVEVLRRRNGGGAMMLTSFREGHKLVSFLRSRSTEAIALLVGLDALVHMFHEGVSKATEGGVLEAIGRMMLPDTSLYVFPMGAGALRARLEALGIEPGFCTIPAKDKIAVTDIRLASPVGRLLEFLVESGWVRAAEGGANDPAVIVKF